MDGRDRGQNSGSLGPGTAMGRGAGGEWMEFISILIWRVVIRVYTYVEILPAVPLRLVHFTVCILQLCVHSTSKKKWRMSHFSLESVFPIGSKIRPEGFSENSLYFCYNQISFSNKLFPITFKKKKKEGGRWKGRRSSSGRRKEGWREEGSKL